MSSELLGLNERRVPCFRGGCASTAFVQDHRESMWSLRQTDQLA
jgi:hypothetical protein